MAAPYISLTAMMHELQHPSTPSSSQQQHLLSQHQPQRPHQPQQEPRWKLQEREHLTSHLLGSVKEICGGFVCLEVKVDKKIKYKELGPFVHQTDAKCVATKSLEEELWATNVKHQLFTNSYLELTDGSDHVLMRLDADFSDPTPQVHSVRLDRRDLPLIARCQWGLKKLADGRLYAFTQDDTGGLSRFLHDFLLDHDNSRHSLSKFNSGITLDCSRRNMSYVQYVPQWTPVAEIPQVNTKMRPSTHPSPFHGVSWEGNNVRPRWILKYHLGGREVIRTYYLREPKDENEKEKAKAKCLEDREMLLHAQAVQTAYNEAFKAAWRNQPGHSDGITQQDLFRYYTKNDYAEELRDKDEHRLGPWLRGRIEQHGGKDGKWCLRYDNSLSKFQHFDTKREAIQAQLEHNRNGPHFSINSYYFDFHDNLPVNQSRFIRLEPRSHDGDLKVFEVSEEEPVIKALSEHIWVAKRVTYLNGDRQIIAVNKDPNSIWQHARDLVVWTKLEEYLKKEHNIHTPRDFFDLVFIRCDPTLDFMWDCRPVCIHFAVLKHPISRVGVITPEARHLKTAFMKVTMALKQPPQRAEIPSEVQEQREKNGANWYKQYLPSASYASASAAAASSSSSAAAAAAAAASAAMPARVLSLRAPSQAASSSSSSYSSSKMEDEDG